MKDFFVAFGCVAVLGFGALFVSERIELRRIAMTTATSNCIGDVSTPLCALETFEACSLRRDDRLCELAAANSTTPRISYHIPPNPRDHRYYWVASIRPVSGGDVGRPEVEAILWIGDGPLSFSSGYWHEFQYLLALDEGKWQVIQWVGDEPL